ncbi:L,D-transpeptidase family protein [Sphingomonas hankyongi]|uniref:L,D-transpeptidase family protein n=1 Tax=Sphingomonas hankyongi TaxID=2908209 RepID=A0ABT0S3W0_9SPHN|nr:L,D-transpeptidase family protein [Sphingomonas hankyongi]MCL6730552.1 L,D-transpeptidase family protein [Sphingomonas hankyongi]
MKPSVLLALGALALPGAAAAQYGMPYPPMPPAPMPMPAPSVRAEPWMAPPPGVQAPQPWGRTAASKSRSPALEPIDLPPAIEQGVDMIYIDEELVPRAVQDPALLHNMSFDDWSGAPVDLFTSVNPIYTDLRRGLMRYQQRWGDLPQTTIPSGPTLKAGVTGDRVSMLRERLGLAPGGSFDAALGSAVKEFQAVHGLKADGVAGAGTIDALNRGARYYEQLIIINMERAKRLPAPEEQRKYAIVDSGGARLSLWENGRKVDEMKVVVGKAETATPMMAAYIRYASVNPYWNVPPELVRNLIGPRIVSQGISYLTEREYQVLSSYGEDAKVLDPSSIDWRAVVDGQQEVRLRRLPSPANSMGMMKFMLPNYFGIYLHDSPEKEHFTKNELWISNGCVRVEDYKRFASWLFGGYVPKGGNPKVEEEVNLPAPVPVYMTYLTVQPTASGIQFLADPYGRDAHLMERFGSRMVAGVGG